MGEPDTMVVDELLPAPTRRLHRMLLTALLEEGAIPAPAALADALDTDRATLRLLIQELVTADYISLGPDGDLTCLYPLSAVPTPHVVAIEGRRRHAMCAIDALGMPAMLEQELTISAVCGQCGAPARFRVRPGSIVAAEPAPAVVVARSDETQPAAGACCPFTVFACGQEHGRQLAARMPGIGVLTLDEGLVHGETLFSDLLRAESLPLRRRRWGRRVLSPVADVDEVR